MFKLRSFLYFNIDRTEIVYEAKGNEYLDNQNKTETEQANLDKENNISQLNGLS